MTGRPRFGAAPMALNLLRSGYATLEYEIAHEKASALGRWLEAALAALAACPQTATSNREIRDGLVEQAGYALWLFVVQREACSLNDSGQVMRDYGVPCPTRCMPAWGHWQQSIHPTKTGS